MSTTVVSPAPVWDVINGYAAYAALVTAVDLGVFDAFEDDAALDAGELTRRIDGQSTEALVLLADTLVSLGLLSHDGSAYRRTPVAARYLVSGAPHEMTALVRLSPGPAASWARLAQTVRAGRAAVGVGDDPGAFYPDLVAATAPTQRAVAAATAGELDARGWLPQAPTVLDLGAGSAAWATAFLAVRPDAAAVAVDLPEVIGTTERLAAAFADRLTIVAGDYLDVALPAADVVVLGHVLRAEPADRARALVRRAVEVAGRTGTVVVADYPRPDPVGPGAADRDAVLASARHELLLSLTMLASTGGRGVTEHELRDWCADAGASVVARLEPLPRQHVFLIRPDTSSVAGPDKEIPA